MARRLDVVVRVRAAQHERLMSLAQRLSVRHLDLLRVAIALGVAHLEQIAADPEGAKRILEAVGRVSEMEK